MCSPLEGCTAIEATDGLWLSSVYYSCRRRLMVPLQTPDPALRPSVRTLSLTRCILPVCWDSRFCFKFLSKHLLQSCSFVCCTSPIFSPFVPWATTFSFAWADAEQLYDLVEVAERLSHSYNTCVCMCGFCGLRNLLCVINKYPEMKSFSIFSKDLKTHRVMLCKCKSRCVQFSDFCCSCS